ncbi:SMP-30/gluconolactonase/LRE family protein [Erythrobacter tepidarius]|uniref:SMP-30/gluconolactonase/LRE family protein n=1 Tax=Erythrobacter tepidarius TaxID=60454 RepID=UPI000A3BEEEE|nr:SMP-30/gluconolactonase/LRE family protein [Erythrobacter tepidarius]
MTAEAATIELVKIIPAQCALGEGPVWDHRLGCLWFTDIAAAQLLRLDWPSAALTRFDLPERLGSLGLTDDPAQLICAFASGFALYTPATGACAWLCKTEPDYRGLRMNDGRIDREGRFWAGSMVEDSTLAPPEQATLYRLDGESATAVRRGIAISNAIAFAPDGTVLYFTDTPTQVIERYQLDPATGALGAAEIFARLTGNAYPDGADVDAAGRLWNAEWGSGRVTAYNSDGSRFVQIELPVSQVSCVTFGGADCNLLFVTTARTGLSDEALAKEPQAGDLFVYRAGVTGLPAPVWRGRGRRR